MPAKPVGGGDAGGDAGGGEAGADSHVPAPPDGAPQMCEIFSTPSSFGLSLRLTSTLSMPPSDMVDPLSFEFHPSAVPEALNACELLGTVDHELPPPIALPPHSPPDPPKDALLPPFIVEQLTPPAGGGGLVVEPAKRVAAAQTNARGNPLHCAKGIFTNDPTARVQTKANGAPSYELLPFHHMPCICMHIYAYA